MEIRLFFFMVGIKRLVRVEFYEICVIDRFFLRKINYQEMILGATVQQMKFK